MELLAPAGSPASLKAAVQSGADAVYIGGSRFSARSSATNFDDAALIEYVNYCHKRDVLVHVAANTLIKENECDDFIEYVGFLNDIGVDAVIIQDLGMASIIKKLYPDLPIHASTQLTCASVKSAKFLEELGFSRIVLARELDFESIENICRNTLCEIEVFVHGAICMSYSGQCLMSSMIGGRSGNRGNCAQPCRLPYNFFHNGKNVNNGYLLSPKDMCLVNHLQKLEKIGVSSLKIEGRLKRSEYVSSVVGVYRKCLDFRRCATDKEYDELLNAFNRSGFTDGYFTKNTGKNMMAYDNPSNSAQNIFTKDTLLRCDENANFKKIPIKIECDIHIGMPITLRISDYKSNEAVVFGDVDAQYAINKALDDKRVSQQLQKLGNSIYIANEVYCNIDDNISLPISEINNTRRKAVSVLDELRIKPQKRRHFNNDTCEFIDKKTDAMKLSCMCRTLEQVKICINADIPKIYAPEDIVKQLNNDRLISICPPIDKENKNNYSFGSKHKIASSYGQVNTENATDYTLDYRLNITNSYTAKLFSQFSCQTLSPELTINELKAIKKPCETEVIAYGRLPLMTFENCPVKANGKCDKGKSQNYLQDRMGEKFPLLCSLGCFCVLYNSKPIYMADKIDDLKKTNITYLRLNFTDETADECGKIICDYQNALKGIRPLPLKENTFTRGHFYKKTD